MKDEFSYPLGECQSAFHWDFGAALGGVCVCVCVEVTCELDRKQHHHHQHRKERQLSEMLTYSQEDKESLLTLSLCSS